MENSPICLGVILPENGSVCAARPTTGSHLEQRRLQTIAQVGEAMAITGVLFSGLGFVALIATVWLQRQQIQAAIRGMEESTQAQQDNLKTLRVQSENTLAVAKISALAVQISACSQRVAEFTSVGPSATAFGQIEIDKRTNLIAELEAQLEKLKEKSRESPAP